MLRFLALMAALLGPAADARAQQAQDRIGNAYEIHVTNTTESTSDNGSSSSSQSGGMLIERVVTVRDDGLELEFDLPSDATEEERAQDWQWPARVLKSPDGSLQLLNTAELEARIEAWLVLGELPREACGHWIFTWNAFKIECDPQSVISTLGAYDLRLGDLRDGARHTEPGGLGPMSLRRESSGPEGAVFVGETPLNPDFVRREGAESDVAAGEIMGEPTTLEAALEARETEQATGTITTTFATDNLGRVTRRTVVTNMTRNAGGVVEHTTATLTVERRRLATPGA